MTTAERIEALDAALNSLDWSVSALCATHPDPADYVHTVGADAYVAAKEAHDSRLQRLIDVRAELNALANRLEEEAA
jgi:hypothetical protein